MADADVPITAGSGTKIDTRTVGAGTDEHRQVVVVGDPATAAAVQNVDATLGASLSASAVYSPTSGTITSATSTVTSGDITRAGNITIAIFGTYAGVNAAFEVSPDAGTTWFAVSATREDTALTETTTGVLPSNQARIWTTGAPGFNRVRVRATAWTSGTANVIIVCGTLPIEPLVATVVNGSLPTGTNSIGQVTANAGTGPFPVSDNAGSLTVDAPVGTPLFARLSDGSAALAGQKTMANSIPVTVASDQSAMTQPTLTKGTQGSTGLSVQNLKDAGRVAIAWTVSGFVTTATTEGLLTVTESRDGAATTTFTSKTITNGKRLRIQAISFIAGAGGSAPAISRMTIRVRVNTAGATTTSSPLQWIGAAGIAGAAKSMSAEYFHEFPDGMEFLGDGTKTIGVTCECLDWVTGTNTPQLWALAITAFEY